MTIRILGTLMRIQIDNPGLVDELVSYLRECRCELEGIHRTSFEALPPAAATDPHLARLQLDGFLWAWAARHPEATISVHESARPGRRDPDLMESVSGHASLDVRNNVR